MAKKSWLAKQAEEKGELMGMKINLMVDNSPVNRCFEKVEALRNGISFEEKSSTKILLEDVVTSARRMDLIE